MAAITLRVPLPVLPVSHLNTWGADADIPWSTRLLHLQKQPYVQYPVPRQRMAKYHQTRTLNQNNIP